MSLFAYNKQGVHILQRIFLPDRTKSMCSAIYIFTRSFIFRVLHFKQWAGKSDRLPLGTSQHLAI